MNKNLKGILALAGVAALAIPLTGCDDFYIAMNEGKYAFHQNEDGEPYTFFNANNAFAVIDETMQRKYIMASLAAIVEFNKINGITIDFVIGDPLIYQYDILFTEYRDELIDYCSTDDSDVVACNNAEADGYNFLSTHIAFNDNVIEDLDEAWVTNVAIHELGHTFGLKDLYENVFEELSIMYFQADDVILDGLTEWDIGNLNEVYGG